MSRGLGKLQREVLRIVEENVNTTCGGGGPPCLAVAEIAGKLFGEGFTDTQRRSVARAATTLQDRGLIELHPGARRFRHSEETQTRLVDFLEGWHPEPTTSRGKLLRAAGLIERSYRITHTLPIPETFVSRLRSRNPIPPEVIEADRALRRHP